MTLSSSNHAFQTTAKKVILRQGKNEKDCEMLKTEKKKKASAKRAKLPFSI